MSTSKKGRSIVARVLSILNITEEGKIGHFYDRVANYLNRNIKALEHNEKSLKFSYDADISAINEQIEDTEDAVEAAYNNVVIDRISNNKEQDSFMETYLREIDRAEAALKALQTRKKSIEDTYQASLKDSQAQVKEYKRRLDKIS